MATVFFAMTVCPWFSLTMMVKEPLLWVVLLVPVEFVVFPPVEFVDAAGVLADVEATVLVSVLVFSVVLVCLVAVVELLV